MAVLDGRKTAQEKDLARRAFQGDKGGKEPEADVMIHNWYKARRALEVAEASCEYDRGYFLHREYQAVEKAEAKMAAALNAWIDQRLAAHNAKGGV